MLTQIVRLHTALAADRCGVTALEYAVVAGVVVTVIFAGFTAFGDAMKTALVSIAAAIPT